MDFLKNIGLSLWNNHRKKVVAFVLGLLFGVLASLTGIPLSEIKEAAHDASKPEVTALDTPISNVPANNAPEL